MLFSVGGDLLYSVLNEHFTGLWLFQGRIVEYDCKKAQDVPGSLEACVEI